jgi:hypothetical protein
MNTARALVAILASLPCVAFAQAASQPSANWLAEADAYVKVVGAVLTGLGTLFGLPIAALVFRKTRAEIRKLELEAAALQGKANASGEVHAGTNISIKNSHNLSVQVLADPRFLGPLLLLLDFILAWVVLTLAGIFLRLFDLGIISTALLGILAAALLAPIAKEARRVRQTLRTGYLQHEEAREKTDA